MPSNKERFDQDVAAITNVLQTQGTTRNDANEAIYFARQLEFIRSKTYDIKRPLLSARQIFPIDTSVPEWATKVTYRQFDANGIAKIISSYADDLPMVGLSAKEFTSPVRSLGDAYGWDMAELRSAAATNTPLKSNLATMAQKGHDIAVNKIAWFGDTISGLPGFLTNTNIPVYSIPANGTGSSKTFASKTPDQILADLNGFVNSIVLQSNGVHRANQLWLPLPILTYISTTIRGSLSDSTILEVFQKNNPGIEVKSVLELANVPSYSNQNVMVAGEVSVENLQLILPMEFKQYPPQANNLAVKVPCESRVGGVVVEYPFAFAVAQGI